MCSQYELKTLSEVLSEALPELELRQSFEISHRMLPSTQAGVLVGNGERLRMAKMKFSLVPSWSKDPKIKFASHNARIETVHEKPTWQTPFLSQHCVVPMSGFFEAVYKGPFAGNVIEFKDRSGGILFAAAVFDHWTHDPDPANHFFSFSILTEEPTQFILDHGHDRSPIFLKTEHVKDWCQLRTKKFDEGKTKLKEWSFRPELEVRIERPLKAGWEKRA